MTGVPSELVWLIGFLLFLERADRQPPPAARRWDQRIRACFDDALSLVEHCCASRRRELAMLERAIKASPRRYQA